MTAGDCVIGCRGVAKRFGHVEALRNANLTVPAGKVVALVGDNGAGKSTLMKTLLGINKPDQGEVIIADQPVRLSSIRDVQALGVEAVHQDLALAPQLSVVDNMFLGHEVTRGFVGIMARKEMAERAAVVDARYGKGHVLLFASNPMWRGETIGSYPLVLNAIVHFDKL